MSVSCTSNLLARTCDTDKNSPFSRLQLTISLHTFLCMTLHIIRPWTDTKIFRTWYFSCPPRKFSIPTWLCNCPQYLCLFHIVCECTPGFSWSTKDVGSPKTTPSLSTFHIGSMCCFFPTNFMSSTCTDKNNPFPRCTKRHSQFGMFSQPCFNKIFSNCLSHNSPGRGWPYRFRSRKTTGSSILDDDFGHLCFGRRIQLIWTFWLWNVYKRWCILHFDLGASGYCVCCLSCASW